MRKKARSIAVPASTLRIQDGSAPLAVTANPAATSARQTPAEHTFSLSEKSRNDLNVHPLRSHVVRNIFRGDGEPVRSRNHLFRNEQLACIHAGLGIPLQPNGSRSLQPCNQAPR